jgi:hypothetical protein
MPQILPPSAWIEFRGVPNLKTLNEGALHFALVKDPDGNEHKCVVKLIDLTTSAGLLCEGLGWLLAQASGVNVPAFAAVLRVPIGKLENSMKLPSFVSGHSEYLAWCVEVVDGKALLQVHKWIFWLARLKCLYAKNTPVIAAFDYWADNRDRNYGNVIRSKDGQYVAIDHESLLDQVVWQRYFGLSFKKNSLLDEAELRLSPHRVHKFKCEMGLAAEGHANAIKSTNAASLTFVQNIIPDAAFAKSLWTEIEIFLTSRAQSGWLSGELGVIV